MFATAISPTRGMVTGYSDFQLAEIHEEAQVSDPVVSLCPRCLCYQSIFFLTLNDQGEFVCECGCEEYKSDY